MKTADYWIDNLQLQEHPEGGFYRETYRSKERVVSSSLPDRFRGDRNFSTSIYFLLRSQDRSLFHRIQSDEIWYYHAGSSLTLYILNDDGLTYHRLGPDPERSDSLQIRIPASSWFGAVVNENNSYTLSSCSVSPGFDFEDFELASRTYLLKTFPHATEVIELMTKD
jgi:predicted cupin superfamily sugar epimerase